jgi:hypothetical protein
MKTVLTLMSGLLLAACQSPMPKSKPILYDGITPHVDRRRTTVVQNPSTINRDRQVRIRRSRPGVRPSIDQSTSRAFAPEVRVLELDGKRWTCIERKKES